MEILAIAEPESLYPETTTFKSTRPSGSGDPEQNSTGHSYSGSAIKCVDRQHDCLQRLDSDHRPPKMATTVDCVPASKPQSQGTAPS